MAACSHDWRCKQQKSCRLARKAFKHPQCFLHFICCVQVYKLGFADTMPSPVLFYKDPGTSLKLDTITNLKHSLVLIKLFVKVKKVWRKTTNKLLLNHTVSNSQAFFPKGRKQLVCDSSPTLTNVLPFFLSNTASQCPLSLASGQFAK